MPKKASSPPSIRSLAELTGYSTYTVSAALRDSPKVAIATRETIKKAAKEAGYRPSAVLAALGASRYRRGSEQSFIVALALVPEGFWTQHAELRLKHVKALASEEDIQLETKIIHEQCQLEAALKAWYYRGVEGILIQYWIADFALDELDTHIDHFAWLTLKPVGPGMHFPVHSVEIDLHRNLTDAWHKAVGQGFQRIGSAFIAHPQAHSIADDLERRSGVFLSQRLYPDLPEIPPLFVPVSALDTLESSDATALMQDWLETHQPDVVLGMNGIIYNLIKRTGRLMPEDLAFVHLDFEKATNQIVRVSVAGLQGAGTLRQTVALRKLIRLIVDREHGLPQSPRRTSIRGIWQDGETLPAASAIKKTH